MPLISALVGRARAISGIFRPAWYIEFQSVKSTYKDGGEKERERERERERDRQRKNTNTR